MIDTWNELLECSQFVLKTVKLVYNISYTFFELTIKDKL